METVRIVVMVILWELLVSISTRVELCSTYMYTGLIRRERVTFRASILGKQNKHDYYYAYCQYYDDECIDNKCWSREKYNGLYI